MGTVIDHLAATGHGTGLQVVDTHAVTAIDDAVGPHPEAAKFRHAHLGDVVLRKAGYKLRCDAVIGQRYGHVGLAAAKGSIELMRLAEPLVARRRKAKHHFAESYYFCHVILFIYNSLTIWNHAADWVMSPLDQQDPKQ